MWKDKRGGKGLSVYVTYRVKGLNLDRFINTVKNRGITLCDVKKQSQNVIKVSVSLKQSEKFFAIAKELCYNIRKIGLKGKGYPLYKLLTSFGAVLGATIFIATQVFLSDLVFECCYTGTGSVYQNEVESYLLSEGVKKYSRFSKIDLNVLADRILSDGERFSFVSCYKKGNRLMVNLTLAHENTPIINGNVYSVISDVDGVVQSIKVYRGTPLVKVGDQIKAGDILVDGYAVIKEQTVNINVLATVTLIVKEKTEYFFNEDRKEDYALALAEGQAKSKEIVNSVVNKIAVDGGYLYSVEVDYKRVLFAG